MKRSIAVVLTLAAGAGLWYALTPGDDDEAIAGNLYSDPDACAADARYTRDQCMTAFVNASQQHHESAPRYASDADCRAEFEGSVCEPVSVPGAATAYVPPMAGFVIAAGVAGALAATAVPSAMPVYRRCDSGVDPQACRTGTSSSGFFRYYTNAGYSLSRGGTGSSVSMARSGVGAAGSSATMGRGGFGARAAAHGGGGHS